MNKLLVTFVLVSISLMMVTSMPSALMAQQAPLTKADNQAKQEIIGNLSSAADHRYDRYDLLIGSFKGDNSTFSVYNKTGQENQSAPPINCGPGTHDVNGQCVPDVVPPNDNTTNPNDNGSNPNPQPNQTSTTKINLAGDFDCSANVISAMKAKPAFMNIALGDLCYKSTLNGFMTQWNQLTGHACLIGNHDANEDSKGDPIVAQAQSYCGDFWTKKVAGGTTLLVGYNTNGNLDVQLGSAQALLQNDTYMGGVKNVVLMSHKPCETHPNSHHTVEANVKTFCQSFDAKVPQGVKIFHIVGHNHEYAKTKDGHSILVGSGGQTSHRGCGTDATWTFCKTGNAFLQLEISNKGDITSKFYNEKGGVIS